MRHAAPPLRCLVHFYGTLPSTHKCIIALASNRTVSLLLRMMTQKLVENAEQFKKQFRAAVVRGLPVAGGIESAHERHFMPWKIVRITHEDSTGSMKIAITYDSLLTYMKGTGKVTMTALADGIVARMYDRRFSVELGGYSSPPLHMRGSARKRKKVHEALEITDHVIHEVTDTDHKEVFENFGNHVNDMTYCRVKDGELPLKFVLGVVIGTQIARVSCNVAKEKHHGGRFGLPNFFTFGAGRDKEASSCFSLKGVVGLGLICYGVRRSPATKNCKLHRREHMS
jgi:hypothetical protein